MKPMTPDEYPWQFAGLSDFYDRGFNGFTGPALSAALAVITREVKNTMF
jgi:hypothetical protein